MSTRCLWKPPDGALNPVPSRSRHGNDLPGGAVPQRRRSRDPDTQLRVSSMPETGLDRTTVVTFLAGQAPSRVE